MTIVLLGLAVGALIAGLATAAGASKQHRDLATSDTVMRSYAEATKQAVRSQCTAASGSYAYTITPSTRRSSRSRTAATIIGSPP